MPLIFSYGTLQQERVQLATFGRRLAGRPDELRGYRQVEVRVGNPEFVAQSGRAVHASLSRTGSGADSVAGMALELTDEELALADRYELAAAYHRTSVTLASGREAWVYSALEPSARS